MKEFLKKFFESNDPVYRIARTIVQGIIGVFLANLDLIIGTFAIDPAWKPILAALTMAVLSPIMANIKVGDEAHG